MKTIFGRFSNWNWMKATSILINIKGGYTFNLNTEGIVWATENGRLGKSHPKSEYSKWPYEERESHEFRRLKAIRPTKLIGG